PQAVLRQVQDLVVSGDDSAVGQSQVLRGGAAAFDDVFTPPPREQRAGLGELGDECLQSWVVQRVGVGGPQVCDSSAGELLPLDEDLLCARVGQQMSAGVVRAACGVEAVQGETLGVGRDDVAEAIKDIRRVR